MANTMEKTMVKSENKTKTLTGEKIRAEILTYTMFSAGIASFAIGVWGFACLAGGLIAAGGPVEMFKMWISAVTGM